MKLISLLIALLLTASAASPASAEPAGAAGRFSVVVEGSGPDVVMIPGLVSSRGVWDDAVRVLGGRYRIHRLQIAGFAGEPAGSSAEGPLLEAIVDQLAAYVRGNRLVRPAFVGHSMGGLIALMLAERSPELIGKVMIVDSLPFYAMLFGPQMTAAAVEPQAARMRDAIAAMDDAAFRAEQQRSTASLVRTEAARPALIED